MFRGSFVYGETVQIGAPLPLPVTSSTSAPVNVYLLNPSTAQVSGTVNIISTNTLNTYVMNPTTATVSGTVMMISTNTLNSYIVNLTTVTFNGISQPVTAAQSGSYTVTAGTGIFAVGGALNVISTNTLNSYVVNPTTSQVSGVVNVISTNTLNVNLLNPATAQVSGTVNVISTNAFSMTGSTVGVMLPIGTALQVYQSTSGVYASTVTAAVMNSSGTFLTVQQTTGTVLDLNGNPVAVASFTPRDANRTPDGRYSQPTSDEQVRVLLEQILYWERVQAWFLRSLLDRSYSGKEPLLDYNLEQGELTK